MKDLDQKQQQQLKLHFRRFEIKYLITPAMKFRIRNYLKGWLRPDPFSGADGGYTITSIYFDSPGLRFYRENEAGLINRQKIRHRYYNQDKSRVFWEVKRKIDSVVVKDRCLASRPSSEMAEYLASRKKLWRLRPVAWVNYSREPWIGPDDMRVTFDSRLAAGRPAEIILDSPRKVIPMLGGREVMEFKYSGRLPRQLSRIIYKFNLQRQAIGKYRLAIETPGVLY